jgi:hypothetical protein
MSETKRLLLLLLLAAVVRIYWGLQPRVVWGDEPFYLWLGQSLLSGEGYRFFGLSGIHFSPLFPLLAALIGWLAGIFLTGPGQALAAGSVVLYVVCGALLVLPIYGIGRRLVGTGPALMAGLVTALYPALTAGVPLWGTMTEPLFLLLIATAWWGLLVALEEGRWRSYGVAGVALALAYLTRTEALVYLVAGLAAVLLLSLVSAGGEDGQRGLFVRLRTPLAGAGVTLTLFLVLISPYLVLMRVETGHWQLVEEAGSTYVSAQGLAYSDTAAFDAATWGLDPASGEVYLFSPASEGEGLLRAIAADVRGFGRRLWVNTKALLATTFSSRLIPWPLAALGVLGLFGRPWDARRLRGELLLTASLVGPLSFIPFFIQTRYLAGALIPALVWIGAGAVRLGEWLSGTVAGCGHLPPGLHGCVGAGLHVPRGPAQAQVSRTVDRETRLSESEVLEATGHAVRDLGALPALLLALALLWQGPRLWAALHETHSFQPGHLAAAQALRELGAPAHAMVMSRYPAIAFHAGTRWAPTPAASWPQVEAYARERDARYLVLDAWEARLRPQLSFLLDPGVAPRGLEHLTTLDAGTGQVVIYAVR